MEHLAQAQRSRNLADAAEVGELADVDWIRAAGAVGQKHDLALKLWRLLELRDAKALPAVYAGAVALAVRLEMPRAEHVALSVLQYLADPLCRRCHGRGYAVILGTPHLAAEECPRCEGSGKRAPTWGAPEKLLDERLRDMQRQAAAALVRQLS